jgi:hypothetical protein
MSSMRPWPAHGPRASCPRLARALLAPAQPARASVRSRTFARSAPTEWHAVSPSAFHLPKPSIEPSARSSRAPDGAEHPVSSRYCSVSPPDRPVPSSPLGPIQRARRAVPDQIQRTPRPCPLQLRRSASESLSSLCCTWPRALSTTQPGEQRPVRPIAILGSLARPWQAQATPTRSAG